MKEVTFDTSPLRDDDVMSDWAMKIYADKYAWKDENEEPQEVWPDTAYRAVKYPLKALGLSEDDEDFRRLVALVSQRKFMPAGRFLAMSGRDYHPINNCFLLRVEDSREGWAEVVRKSILALSGGGGVGVVYSDVRPNGTPIKKTGGTATGPISPASMINEVARHVMAGGNRRSALWGGLHWWHQDIFDWITVKDWSLDLKAAKEKDFNSPAPLDMTNISVILDTEFFQAYYDQSHPKHFHALEVYWKALEHMLAHGEPGFSINIGQDEVECLRNPCTEITSADDSDVCCLGSINMARMESKEEFAEAVSLGTLYLLAGTVYSDIPFVDVAKTRAKNRRIGLGLMGIHEWLLQRGYEYKMNDELREWLEIYETSTEAAHHWADEFGISRPIKTRAIAPTGTISIIAETTSGIEPVFCVAYKRRFLDNDRQWRYQYVIDPTVQRLQEQYGLNPDQIEDAYSLAYNPEKRVRFQAELERYVDHACSSTINLPEPIVDTLDIREFGEMLLEYLPQLRGITVYPNGARGGQPLTVATYHEAADKLGVTFEEEIEGRCVSGVCGV